MSKILISGSFIIEPLRDTLNFWVQEIPLKCEIKFSPYNQIFQTLLADDGRNDAIVLLIRDKDLFHSNNVDNFHLFIQYLRTACKSSSSNIFVIHCPDEIGSKWEGYRKQEISSIPGAYYIELQEWLEKYNVNVFFDFKTEKSSHIPYTALVYTVLGTLIARIIYTLQSPIIKLVGVDCDNTLWRGVVAEEKITIHVEFQRWLLELHQKGIALALFSKNEIEDVEAVFDNHPDMILKKDSITAWYVNWINKAQNLSHLIKTLNIGDDSVLFLDDNPIECAIVSSFIPEAVVVQFEPLFFHHIWDIPIYHKGTTEDIERPTMYRQHLRRESLKHNSKSFSEFIDSLDLRIQISLIKDNEIERVAQLTQRTNQFNASTHRRKSQQIQEFLEDEKKSIHVIHAKDRFGSYGLVGTIFLEEIEDLLIVDTLLLSCRVLGRGIEHEMASFIGKVADGKSVVVQYSQTKRNTPMKKFLESLNPLAFDGISYLFNSEVLARTSFKSDQMQFFEPLVSEIKSVQELAFNRSDLTKLTSALNTAENIRNRIRKKSFSKPDDSANALESLIIRCMSEVLNMEGINVKDHFFSSLGGDSFDAAVLASRLEEVTNKAIDITHIFDHPTAEALSHTIFKLPLISNFETKNDSENVPASIEQIAIWYGMRATSQPSVYQIQLAYYIEGDLDVERLKSCLNILKNRYDVFQISFQFLENGLIKTNEEYYSHQLVQTSPFLWKFEVMFHHVICDEQSIAIFMQELSALYNNPSKELPFCGTYANYCLHQEREIPYQTLKFWKKQLPFKTPPMNPDRKAEFHNISIKPCLKEKILNLSKAHEVTPFTMLLAAFAVCFRIFSQEDRFLVGIPFSTRRSDKIFGLFINLLPVSFTFENEMLFKDLLLSCKKNISQIFKHRFTPFYSIQEKLGSSIHLNIVFNWNRRIGQTPNLNELKVTRLNTSSNFSEFDLSFIIEEDENGWEINIQYASSTYENWQIKTLGKNFISVLEKITMQFDLPIDTLIPFFKNDKIKEDPNEFQSLVEMIESADPMSVALENEKVTLTYQDLNERVNQLAYSFLEKGLGLNKGAVVCLEDPIEQIIATIAVLKTGGYFIPLDNNDPLEHRKGIIEDVKPFLQINQISYELLVNLPKTNLNIPISSNDIAYIIYTSGSTGKPKGVIIEHGGLSHRTTHARHLFNLSSNKRVLCQASPAFDMHIAEWGFTLANGATLCPYRGEVKYLWHFINRMQVSHAILTPGVLGIFPEPPLSHLKYLMVAGEITPQNLMEKWSKHTNMFNGYGPTECTIFTHVHRFDGMQSARIIGQSVTGIECSVIDDKGKCVHEGGVGELYIRGVGVTRGYIGSEPYTDHQYKTGDLVRVLPNGFFEYIGRKDHLIKVNGCRVDIHLIENKVLSIPNVLEAAVIPIRINEHKLMLTCFYSGHLDDVKIIRRNLRKQLPLFMIPTQYFYLDKLPRLLNGKINREKLISEVKPNQTSPIYIWSDLETELGNIWQKILGETPQHGGADFFQMGGDSLQAVQLILEIEKTWRIEILIPELLEHSNLQELAEFIALRHASQKKQTVIQIQTKGSRTPLFLVHPSIGLADCYRPLSKHLQERPIYGMQNPFIVDRSNCFSSLIEMAIYYSNEIKKICPLGPYIIGGWSFGGVVALEVANILKKSGNSINHVILLDSYAPGIDLDEFFFPSDSDDFLSELRHNAKLLKNHQSSNYDGTVHLIRAGNSIQKDNGWNFLPHLLIQDIDVRHHEMFDISNIPKIAKAIETSLVK